MDDTHVTELTHCQGAAPSVNSKKLQVTGQSEKTLHDEGKVNLTTEKVNCNLTSNGKDGMRPLLPEADLVGEMSWETSKNEDVGRKTEEEPDKQYTHKEVGKDLGLDSSAGGSWANNNSSPLAMTYNQEKGWVTEPLGPTSGHWKRLARKVTTPSPKTVWPKQSQTQRSGSSTRVRPECYKLKTKKGEIPER